MIVKVFSQLVLASTFLQLFPVDAQDLEILIDPVGAAERGGSEKNRCPCLNNEKTAV